LLGSWYRDLSGEESLAKIAGGIIGEDLAKLYTLLKPSKDNQAYNLLAAAYALEPREMQNFQHAGTAVANEMATLMSGFSAYSKAYSLAKYGMELNQDGSRTINKDSGYSALLAALGVQPAEDILELQNYKGKAGKTAFDAHVYDLGRAIRKTQIELFKAIRDPGLSEAQRAQRMAYWKEVQSRFYRIATPNERVKLQKELNVWSTIDIESLNNWYDALDPGNAPAYESR
jgi:hypothetical protein